MQVFTPGDEEFDALLGTIHGKSVAYMLADYCGWAKQRKVVRIRTTNVPYNGDVRRGGWYMLFEID